VSNQILKKSYIAGAAGITPSSIVKFSAAGTVVLAAAATDALLGVTDPFCNPALGDRLDVTLMGIMEVKLGGTVARGALVTANAAGLGIVAATTNRVIGEALESGVVGDVIPVLVERSLLP
jgi:hypothetical protein